MKLSNAKFHYSTRASFCEHLMQDLKMIYDIAASKMHVPVSLREHILRPNTRLCKR